MVKVMVYPAAASFSTNNRPDTDAIEDRSLAESYDRYMGAVLDSNVTDQILPEYLILTTNMMKSLRDSFTLKSEQYEEIQNRIQRQVLSGVFHGQPL